MSAVKSTSELRTALLQLTNSQVGSFGERIFAEVVAETRKVSVVPVHDDGTDFILDGKQRVDVKARLALRHNKSEASVPLRPYRGERASAEIDYAQVEIFSDCTRVSIEHEALALLNWRRLLSIWHAWRQGRYRGTTHPMPRGRDPRWRAMKDEIEGWYRERNLVARAIMRRTQDQFGNRGPHDLWPKKGEDVVVFVRFRNYEISYTNIHIRRRASS